MVIAFLYSCTWPNFDADGILFFSREEKNECYMYYSLYSNSTSTLLVYYLGYWVLYSGTVEHKFDTHTSLESSDSELFNGVSYTVCRRDPGTGTSEFNVTRIPRVSHNPNPPPSAATGIAAGGVGIAS